MATFTNPGDPAANPTANLDQPNPYPAFENQLPSMNQTDTTAGLEIRDSKGNLKMLPNAWVGQHKDDGIEAIDTGRLEVDDTDEKDREDQSTAPVNKTNVSNIGALMANVSTDMTAGKEASTRVGIE